MYSRSGQSPICSSAVRRSSSAGIISTGFPRVQPATEPRNPDRAPPAKSATCSGAGARSSYVTCSATTSAHPLGSEYGQLERMGASSIRRASSAIAFRSTSATTRPKRALEVPATRRPAPILVADHRTELQAQHRIAQETWDSS